MIRIPDLPRKPNFKPIRWNLWFRHFFRRQPFWKWRPSWKLQKSIAALQGPEYIDTKFSSNPLSRLLVRGGTSSWHRRGIIIIITSADCDCKQVTEKSPPVRHVVRHVKICLEINFHWNRTRFVFFMIYFVFFSNSKWPPFQDGRQNQNFKSWNINFRWCLIFVQSFIELRLFVS